MKEQCDYLGSLGFTATYIGRNSDEETAILKGEPEFLYSSPENIVGNTKWRDMVGSSCSIKLIVVDEAHTVLHWGESDTENAPFRAWYGRLGEIRSLIACPVLLITATANRASRKKLQKKFCMKECFEIIQNPDRDNIKLFVHKYKSTVPLSEIFQFLIVMLTDKKENCERFLIFCPSIKLCGKLFTMFILEVGSNIQYIEMYHSITTDLVKEEVKTDMTNKDGKIRILVATSAAGMGVNFTGVKNVINFGPPKNMDSFVQQFGRAGRDGSQSMGLLLFYGKQCKNVDQDIKDYICNKTECRRQTILGAYNAEPSQTLVKHLCCDICAVNCSCGNEECSNFQHPFFDVHGDHASSSSDDDNLSDSFSNAESSSENE